MNLASRRFQLPLVAAWAVAAVLFLLDTFDAFRSAYLPFDRPIESWVQSVPWGPLDYVMRLTNWISESKQALLAILVAGLVLLFISTARGVLFIAASLANLWETILKEVVHRGRPSGSLVQVREHANGLGYPSGHATFYTWLAIMVAVTLIPRISPRLRPIAWVLAVAVIVVACLGRVWAGVHWPSDVLGGFLLSLIWLGIVAFATQRSPGRRARELIQRALPAGVSPEDPLTEAIRQQQVR
jgi:undecaprenyl-diphosphatase